VVGTAQFSRSNRLLRSSDFKLLSRRGKRAAGRHFVILWALRTDQDHLERARIGITVSRKVGNAVVRNRVKRRVREWYRQNRDELRSDLDFVVIARPSAADLGTLNTWEILRKMVRQNSVGRT
jgi:ribonuclease P protein component